MGECADRAWILDAQLVRRWHRLGAYPLTQSCSANTVQQMLNIPERRDLIIALAGRMVSTFGDGVALVALTLRLQADGAHPYEVALLLAAGVIPQLLLARPIGRLVDTHDSRRLLVGGGVAEVA